MRPAFRILADRVDVTRAIRDRLLELVVIDEAGIEADELRLTLDDRRTESGAVAELPRIGTRLEVSLGYEETGVAPMGVYLVDEMEISAPPATLIVSAKAADMSSPLRALKTRSHDGLTLGELAARIAREHGLVPVVEARLAAIALGHVDQTAESDMALLTRLASHYDAIAKPAGDKLVLAMRGQAKTASGRAMPEIALAAGDIIEWRYRRSARAPGGSGRPERPEDAASLAAGGVKAYYWDFDAGERREVTVGKPPHSEIRHVYVSREKALAAAQAAQNGGARAQAELSLTLPGDARIVAESRLRLALRPGIPQTWIVARAEHRIGAQGYTTQLECSVYVY
ncbi:MAG: contractile injection system protein, VgrG/Pvc8 family [Rhodocyclaceae bacterium]|nr:contractile injection system protein, VgrG/Pvc8 family [Rhodocyclaceae bacterium]